ncbi:MAG: hypothetical protein HYY25_04885 [Candidatus Wallbacteria bacterium]|nr:hypothetical protein [Candidatus Wallbacteria bacterium]
MRLACLLACLFGAFVTVSGVARGAEGVDTIERSLTIGGAPQVTISHVTGSIRVTGHAAPTMILRATRRVVSGDVSRSLKRVEVLVEAQTGEAVIRVAHAGVSEWEELKSLSRQGQLDDVSVELVLQVPVGASVDLASVNGELSVEGVEGGLAISSVSSAISLRRVGGGVKINTIGGKVDILGLAGGLSAQSVNGSIRGRVVRGSCVLDTVTGAVELALEPREHVAVRVNSMSGPVALSLPERSAASLDLWTSSGPISGDFLAPVPPGQQRVKARIGRDGPDIAIRTVSGPICVVKQRAP